MKKPIGSIWITTAGEYKGMIVIVTGKNTIKPDLFDSYMVETEILFSPGDLPVIYSKGNTFPLEFGDRPVRFDTWNVALKEFLE